MKKIVAIVLIVCVLIALSSCMMTKEMVNDATLSYLDNKKIGCVIAYEGDEWCSDLSEAIKYYAEEYGADFTMYNADLDPEKQSEQIYEMIDSGCELIMIDPVTDDGVTEAIREAINSGISVILYDESCPEVAEDVITTITWDQKETGRVLAEYLIDYVENNYDNTVNVLGITTDFILNFSERFEGFKEVIENSDSDINIVDIIDSGLSREEAYDAVSASNSEFDIVVGGMDVHAFGAIDAMEEAGKDDVKAFSFGGYGEEAFNKIKEDNSMYIAFCTIDPWLLAKKLFDVASIYCSGHDVEKHIEMNQIIVDKSNISDFMTE